MYDVAIVGASIAGCTAAILFARAGATVALLERDPDPAAYKKICTHYLQPHVVPVLDRLGLTARIEAAGGVPNPVELWTRWGCIRHSGPPLRHGYNIRRQTLDPMLRGMAAETAGVTFLPGHTVSGLLRDRGAISGIITQERSAVRQINARLVIAADGAQSGIARQAGLRARAKPHGRFVYMAHFTDLPLVEPGLTQIWFNEPDVAYSFPNDDGRTVVAVMPAAASLDRWKADPEGCLAAGFVGLPRAPRIAEARRVSPMLGSLKLPCQSRPVTAPGLALVGDAALATDPLWGTGCGWAFSSAAWLVDCVAPALLNGGNLSNALAAYRRRHHRELAAHASLIADFASGRPFNAIEQLMFSAAARDPACATHLVRFAGREMSVARFLSPSAVMRAIAVNGMHWAGVRPDRQAALGHALSEP